MPALGLARLGQLWHMGQTPSSQAAEVPCHLPVPCCSSPNLSQAPGEQERPLSISLGRDGFPFPFPFSSPCLDAHHWKQRSEQVILALTFMVLLLPGGEGDLDPPQHFAGRAAMARVPLI